MAVPDFLRDQVDEADAVEHRALYDIVGRQEAVDIAGAQVRHHFRRRHDAKLHVGIRIDAVLGEIIAQQIIMVRIVEGNREFQTLPGLGIAAILQIHRKADRLTVDVLDRRNREWHAHRAEPHRDRDRHRRQHVGGVVFLVDGLVADDRPAGGLDHVNVELLLGIEAERMGHDDRGCAGDRDEADRELGLFQRTRLREGLGRGRDREDLRECYRDRGGADGGEQRAARHRIGEGGLQHRFLDSSAKTLFAQALASQARVVIHAAGAGQAEIVWSSLSSSHVHSGAAFMPRPIDFAE